MATTKAPANTTIKKKEPAKPAAKTTAKPAAKTTAKPAAKAEAKPAAKPAAKAPAKAPANNTVKAKPAAKAEAKPAKKTPLVDTNKIIVSNKPVAKTTSKKTVYHVSKRDRNGREWKVFIQESDKVIKLFGTQDEALKYAKSLCKNKDDGSYVVLHGLDGSIRKF